ncbi:uncharacterized protein TDEL_0A07350 [Torulaspora delbrueckii]|uniref:Uncharacterized protein n=1 Tax=Torulaspora delbrueckii TaxID=4950 RepID=G8ZN73_TORDE|nr:hypothetical protein TDEL_0A07350 [Torulaspora delbrueckii]CCE90067.1 hypothetical protein TDEL_0A07350 [Torulaspora delbrueckii]
MSAFLQPIIKGMDKVTALNAKYLALTFEEQKNMTFVERLRFYNWTFEIFALAMLVLVFVAYKYGVIVNENRAKKLFGSLNSFLQDDLQFARVGFSKGDGSKVPYIEEGQKTWYTTFATGRSAIASLSVRVHMFSRSNPVAMLMESLVNLMFPSSMTVKDVSEYCEVVIKPNGTFVSSETAKPNNDAKDVVNKFKFITSIVNKSSMNELRRENYYLSLTHTSESDKLPVEYVFMSELNQLNGFTLHYADAGFNELLKRAGNFLQSICFTDLPANKPLTDKLWDATQKPRAVIRTKIPVSEQDLSLLKELVSAVVQIFDNVTREIVQKSPQAFINSDILKKSNQLRTQELARIVKAMKQVEREMAQEKKQEAEKEKRRQLKATGEQEKFDQKMKEKRERRLRNKQKVRM